MPAPGRNLLLLTGQTFTPASIAGLKLWLDASRITGLVDGDPVGTWSDLSGNGNHATQATASKKPTLKTGIQNGLPVVRFDGVDDWIRVAFTLPQPQTFWLVFKQTTSVGTSYVADGGITIQMGLKQNGSGGVSQITGSLGAAVAFGTAIFNVGIWYFNSSGTAYTRKNGVTTNAGNTQGAPSAGVILGTRGDQTLPSAIDVAEGGVYAGTLTTAQLLQLEAYLKTKWGTP